MHGNKAHVTCFPVQKCNLFFVEPSLYNFLKRCYQIFALLLLPLSLKQYLFGKKMKAPACLQDSCVGVFFYGGKEASSWLMVVSIQICFSLSRTMFLGVFFPMVKNSHIWIGLIKARRQRNQKNPRLTQPWKWKQKIVLLKNNGNRELGIVNHTNQPIFLKISKLTKCPNPTVSETPGTLSSCFTRAEENHLMIRLWKTRRQQTYKWLECALSIQSKKSGILNVFAECQYLEHNPAHMLQFKRCVAEKKSTKTRTKWEYIQKEFWVMLPFWMMSQQARQ